VSRPFAEPDVVTPITARGSLENEYDCPGIPGSRRKTRGFCAMATVLSAAVSGRSFKARMLTSSFRWVSDESVTLGSERVYRSPNRYRPNGDPT
jgi:hypothetical protein